jgi:subtilase family serine protease
MSIFSNIVKKILVVPTIVERVNNGTGSKASNVVSSLLDPLNLFKKNKAAIDAANQAKKDAKDVVSGAQAEQDAIFSVFGMKVTKTTLIVLGIGAAAIIALIAIFKKKRR